ncbi:hypothetical protein ACFFSH_15870 [Streptomyces filamentosus]|uniref:Uncharacterized protein n=1 Tax=Streptomyces filamentosus TaxID=67294 RepID=A0A919BI41_STRFL|nr:hypothetical protein [Streptomyces filamentosus]GHF90908.1 hypothetical protein GCM10017667_20160 [Streptomyces filamentosus]
MGIESDRMVFDYLSRVGDLAQQRHLPPGDRSALVSGLRDEIDRRRATRGEESPAAVRGILGDLGTPDEVVTRAESRAEPREGASGTGPASGAGSGSGSGTGSAPGSGTAPVPSSRTAPAPPSGSPSRTAPAPPSGSPSRTAPERRGRTAWWSSGAREGAAQEPPAPRKTPSPASAPDPDVPRPRAGDGPAGWWAEGSEGAAAEVRVPGFSGAAEELHVPGFFGGVEAPELFRPPEPEEEAEEEPGEAPAPPGRMRRAVRLLRRRRPAEEAVQEPEPEAAAPARGFAHPFLLLAALLLVVGAAFGWLLALAAGWVIAYGSRRLGPDGVRTAVFVLPGVAAAGSAVWLWGRVEGRWGEAVAAGGEGMSAALADTWPWTLRAAALLSALYLLRRSRRA